MYIPRIVEAQIKKLLTTKKVLIILGARQVGKTTLIKHLLTEKEAFFLNLDVEVDLLRFTAAGHVAPQEAHRSFGSPSYLVIDEAQRLMDVGRIVKGWYDSTIPCKIILLGSSSLNLLDRTAEPLTGRNDKIFLTPLTFRETLSAQSWYARAYTDDMLRNNFSTQLDTTLLTSIVYGQYPEVLTTDDRESLLLNLVADYLLNDIVNLGMIKTPELIRRLLLLLAHQIGSEVSVHELSLNLGIARQTVERYLDLLEQTYVIFRLPAWSTNARKEISKSKKIYFWDTGIRNALLKEFSANPLRSDRGALWENWVVAEFAKANLITGGKQTLSFWRSRGGGEVDLVVTQGEKRTAYEIKWSKQRVTKRAFEDRYGVPVVCVHTQNPLFL